MRLLRIISLFSIVLLLVSVQCRAKCVVTPDVEATKQCPLHKQKAPETNKCTHAPQWDVDDAKQFVASFEVPVMPVLDVAVFVDSVDVPVEPMQLVKPPLILRI